MKSADAWGASSSWGPSWDAEGSHGGAWAGATKGADAWAYPGKVADTWDDAKADVPQNAEAWAGDGGWGGDSSKWGGDSNWGAASSGSIGDAACGATAPGGIDAGGFGAAATGGVGDDSYGTSWTSGPKPDAHPPKKGNVIAPPGKKPTVVVARDVLAQKPVLVAAFIVSTKVQGADANVLRLMGEYAESGTNHGRKMYKKMQYAPGQEVLLYYWDERDGAESSGWWFGTQLGSGEFLSRNASNTQMPPRAGWQVPAGTPAVLNRLLVDPAPSPAVQAAPVAKHVTPAAKHIAPAATQVTPAAKPESGDVIRGLSTRITQLETSGKKVLDDAKVVQGGPALQRAEIALKAQQEKAFEVQRQLNQETSAARAAGATDTISALTQLSTRLRPVLASIVQQLGTLKMKTNKAAGAEVPEPKADATPKVAADPKGAQKGAQKGTMKGTQKGAPKGAQKGGAKVEEMPTAESLAEKAAAAKKAFEEQEAKRKAEVEKRKQEAEQRDQKTLKDILAEISKSVAEAMTAVAVASRAAEPVLKDVDAELNDARKAKIADVEAAAAKAQDLLSDGKRRIASKWRTVNAFTPEVKQNAKKALEDQQSRLAEAQKKVTPLRRLQVEMQQVPALKEALTALKEQVDKADAEIKEAISACEKCLNMKELSEDDAATSDKLLLAAQASTQTAQRAAEGRLRGATGLLVDEFKKQLERANAAQEKLKKTQAAMRPKVEAITPKLIKSAGGDLVEATEKAMSKALDAEFPFMMGQEVLPPDEAAEAFKALDEGVNSVNLAVANVRAFLASKAMALKDFSNKDHAKEGQEGIDELNKRLEPVVKRFAIYMKSAADRKANALVHEVAKDVAEAEAVLEKFAEVAGVLVQDKIEEVAIDAIKEAIEPSKAASKDAASKVSNAKVSVQQKERSAKGAGNFATLNQRVDKMQTKLRGLLNAVHGCDKLVQSKEVFVECAKKLDEAEPAVEKVEELAVGDELSDSTLADLQVATKEAQEALSAAVRGVPPVQQVAPPSMKAPLDALVVRMRAQLAKVEAVKNSTRLQREKWQSRESLKVAKEHLNALEKVMQEAEEAELPFVKGLEGMPSKEAEAVVRKCEEAFKNATARSHEARAFIATKTKESTGFSRDVGKSLAEELAKILVQVGESSGKLGQYRKDIDERKKTTLLQVAGEKLTDIEDDMSKRSEALAPLLAEEMGKLDDKDADALASKLSSLRDEAISAVDDLAAFVAELLQMTKGDPAQKAKIEDIQKRFVKITQDGDGIAKRANAHMHAFLAKELLKDVEERAADVEKVLAGVESAGAPLLEAKGAKFIDASRLRILIGAMKSMLKKDAVELDMAFEKVNDGKAITEAAFIDYFKKLPGHVSRVDLEYTEEQLKAMFKFASNGADTVDKAAFMVLLPEPYVCLRDVVVTEAFAIVADGSGIIERVPPGEFLEATGATKRDEESGVVRVPVIAPSSKKEGWVSLTANKGMWLVEPHTAFSEFTKSMEGTFSDAALGMKAADSFVKKKGAEFGASKTNSGLFEVKDDFNALKKRIGAAAANLESLKRRFLAARKEFYFNERNDRRVQEDLLEQRKADAIFRVAEEKANAMEAEVKKLEEAVAPMSNAAEADALKAVEKPASLKDSAVKLCEAVVASAAAARQAITQQVEAAATGEAGKGKSRPKTDVKQKLLNLRINVDAAEKRAKSLTVAVTAKCKQLVQSWVKDVASAIAEDAQKQEMDLNALFDKVSHGKAVIAEDNFNGYIAKLSGLDVPTEHIQLIFENLAGEGGKGVGRLAFLGIAQRYYVCVKAIGLTDVYNVQATKTVRRTDVGEVFEVLEGPSLDAESGMSRIKCRALLDNAVGWISVTGTSGSAFLKEVPKPCYKAFAQVALEEKVEEDSARVGEIEADELLEVIEGPVEREAAAVRLQAKAVSDGATGYVTAKEQGRDKVYRVLSGIVMTDSQDIKKSNPIRKIETGELLVVMESPEPSETDPVSRIKVKTKDGEVGWLTPKGSKGTVYAEPSAKHWLMSEDTTMTDSVQGGAGAKEVRKILTGEVLEVVSSAKGDGSLMTTRVKGRNKAGIVGWATVNNSIMKKHMV